MNSRHCFRILSAHYSEKIPISSPGMRKSLKYGYTEEEVQPTLYEKKKKKTTSFCFSFDPKLIFLCLTIHSKKRLSQTPRNSDVSRIVMVKKFFFLPFSGLFNRFDVGPI